MSSRILQGAEVKLAEPLAWRPAGDPSPVLPETGASGQDSVDAPADPPPPDPPAPPEPPPPPPPVPAGPSWDEYRELEQRCRQLEARLPEAERQGRDAGRKEGESKALEQYEAALERMTRSAEQMASLRARLRREAEHDVVQLSLAIARRVLRRELSIDPDALAGLVRTALERVELRETQAVRVHPSGAPHITALLERIGGPTRIQVSPDASLEPGALILETQRGQLDASIHVQLEEIERGFADRLNRRSNAGV
jgi:flagellar assembly protein FliH